MNNEPTGRSQQHAEAAAQVPMGGGENTTGVLRETRVFTPRPAKSLGFGAWHVESLERYRQLHEQSIKDPEGFWSEQASRLSWFDPWTRVLDWKAPDARWFVDGAINACYNCVDRHVQAGHGEQTALIWEGEPSFASDPWKAARDGEQNGPFLVRRVTYRDLLEQVSRCANVLRGLGVKPGDVVTIYMPMVPELVVAMLACARLGAAHSIIFGGFAHTSITERVADAGSKIIITADGSYRRGDIVPLLATVGEAVKHLANGGHIVNHVLSLQRTGHLSAVQAGAMIPSPTKLHWWQDAMHGVSDACPCYRSGSSDVLFLLYTSGSTGKPKGIVHSTGGYLTYVNTTARLTFNLEPGTGQIFWCSADIGWVTGHSYVVYGILSNQIPTLLFEGAPNAPANDRFWNIIARHRVTHFYTAPTAIRTFMKWGDELPAKHDLSSLRMLGSVGEPINPEAWMWYHSNIGKGNCPIADTYWQTETGGHVCTPLPGATPTKPGSCTLPMLGIDAVCVNEQGEEVAANQAGLFAIRRPWPGMLMGVHGNRDRFISGYWARLKDPQTGEPYYFSADGARRDEDGYFWIQGRVDDVIKVSGHLLGTMEVESALVSHPAVAEAAVVGMPHAVKGHAICAFVTLRPAWLSRNGRAADEALRKELMAHVAKEMGAFARPEQVRFTDALPKTRSGKIMRRLLRDIAAGVEKITQDTTTLEDFSILAKLKADDE